MSTAQRILADLQARGVRVEASGGQLKLAPRAALTDELLAKAREHKAELIAALMGRGRVVFVAPATCPRCDQPVAPFVLVHPDGSAVGLCGRGHLVPARRDDPMDAPKHREASGGAATHPQRGGRATP